MSHCSANCEIYPILLTPFKLWTGKKPDLSRLRVFGSLAYAHVPDQLRQKLDVKSSNMIMVGYGLNGYRLRDPSNDKIVTRRDVVFDESQVSPNVFVETDAITQAVDEAESSTDSDATNVGHDTGAINNQQDIKILSIRRSL